MRPEKLSKTGVILGGVSSAAALLLWGALAIVIHSDKARIPEESYSRIALMSVLAVVGILASWKGKPLLMLVLALLSFIPIGMYLLGVPSVFRLIGIMNLGLLAASLLIILSWLWGFIERRPTER